MAPLEAKYRGGTGADTRRNTHFFRLEKLGRRGKLDLNRYISTLRITQGEGTGEPLRLFHWERRFLRGAMKPDVSTAALTVARGNGKTTLSAALAVAALDGPLVQKRAEIVLVASSFGQAKILFEHCLAFLEPVIIRDGEGKHGRWRIQDSANLATIEDRRTGARVRCIGSDPRRAHGIAPVLVLADEPAQWEPSKSEKMLAALETGLGKIQGSRLVALGTRPSTPDHWFSKMLLQGGADYSQVHAARAETETARAADPVFWRRTWERANPSLKFMPELLKQIKKEADKARYDPAQLQSFKALRLNLGTPETEVAVLVDAALWREIEAEKVMLPPVIWGVDLGTSAAQSAVASYSIKSGALDVVSAFPELPSLAERGLRDGVGNLYQRCFQRGELILAGKRAVDVEILLREALHRFGRPALVLSDRWRESELRDALDKAGVPTAALELRGQGFKDGGEDVRQFRRACAEGIVTPRESLLLRSAISEARTLTDPAGNSKLSKGSEGGRRTRARDDAAAAGILAVAAGWRKREQGPIAPPWRSLGLTG